MLLEALWRVYQVTEMSNIFEIYFAAHFLKYEPIFEIIIFEIFLKSIFEMKLKSHFEIMCIFHRLANRSLVRRIFRKFDIL